jgi:hypothetical protein
VTGQPWPVTVRPVRPVRPVTPVRCGELSRGREGVTLKIMRRLIAPRVITFDLDDTLWDAAEVLTRAEISFHVYLQQHYPRLAPSYDDARFRTVMKEVSAVTL